MGLSDRKKKILQIVVDDYIQTAVPVSSKQITSKYLTDISSATVRSELSALEELGYLSQPHTSAGRVPSSKAYKLYVTELMQKDKQLTQRTGCKKRNKSYHRTNKLYNPSSIESRSERQVSKRKTI